MEKNRKDVNTQVFPGFPSTNVNFLHFLTYNIKYKSVFECDRKVRTDERLQQKQQLQDAAFGAQTRHEAAMDATGALYDKLMASYTAAHHHLVRQHPAPSVGPPGLDHLMSVLSASCPTVCRAAKRTSNDRRMRSSAAVRRNAWRN